MTRKYKFRAWDKEKKKMINNIEVCQVEHNYPQEDECSECFGDFLNNTRHIVMQWTRLQDKNEKDIYEEDYVQNSRGHNFRVYWLQDDCRFALQAFEGYGAHLGGAEDITEWIDELEIIGNKFENGELLK